MTTRRCSMIAGHRDGIYNHPANRQPGMCPDPARFVCRGTDCYLCARCAEWTRKSGVVLDEVQP